MTSCTLALTPHGRLTAVSVPDAPSLQFELAQQLLTNSGLGSGPVLLGLGAEHVGAALPPVVAWWRDLAVRYLTALCTLPEAADVADVAEASDVAEPLPGRVPPPDAGELQALVWSAPPMDGAEYLSAGVLQQLWRELDVALHTQLQASGQPLGAFLKAHNPAWNLVGRVHLHLAENRKDETFPFAFLATYTTRLSAQGKAQHRPLGEALREYAAAADKARLLALLAPLQRAGEGCAWLKRLIDGREIFQPLRPLLQSQAGTLSGGERRMVSLARGLMADAVLYLVDEPSLGLAPIVSRSVIDALMQIDLGQGAMVIAEQNLTLLSGRVDRVLGMHAGRLKGNQ